MKKSISTFIGFAMVTGMIFFACQKNDQTQGVAPTYASQGSSTGNNPNVTTTGSSTTSGSSSSSTTGSTTGSTTSSTTGSSTTGSTTGSSTTGGTTTGGTMYYTVSGTSYPLSSSNSLYYDPSNQDGSYLSGSATPQSNSVFQLTWVDPNPIDSIPAGTSKTYLFQTDVTVLPNPSYGKATLDIVQNLSMSNEIVWEPTSGTLTISRGTGNTYTFTWTNIAVRNDANFSMTSTSSATYSMTIP